MATSTSTRVRAAVDYEVCMIRKQKGRRKGRGRWKKIMREEKGGRKGGERWERKGGIQGWIERKGKGAERENESNGERERERTF